MNKLTKKFVSLLASTAVVLNTTVPVFAAEVVVSGNGASSTSEVTLNTGSTTTAVQNNTANVTNTVVTTSNTGSNTANRDTNGDVNIDTGDAKTTVSVDNQLNNNTATVGCCENSDTSVTVENNGAGSTNDVSVDDSGSETGVYQNNNANVVNAVTSVSNTGNNSANRDTTGDVSISTGNAVTNVGVSTQANANTATIGGSNATGGSLSVVLAGNGADSENNVDVLLGRNTVVEQTNRATVTNAVATVASTGGNKANENTGGDVSVDTGDTATLVGVANDLNHNWAVVACCGNGGDVIAKIVGNGADSVNDVELLLGGETSVEQLNRATLNNSVVVLGETGDNNANRNTNGTVNVSTGDSDALVGVDNTLNFNYADVECCGEDLLAKIDSNGTDTENTISADFGNETGAWQTNAALLGNGLAVNGLTGDNTANENNGGTLGYDPSVSTGDSQSVVSVENSGNVNQAGGEMPEYQFMFDWEWDTMPQWSWSLFLNMFPW